MKIVKGYPPNIEAIRAKFALSEYVIFTYGGVIYQPGSGVIPLDLMVHEETHEIQQMNFKSPDEWWDKYLDDEKFRLDQEVEAYRRQYEFYKDSKCTKPGGKIREVRLRKFLLKVARDLSGPIYGNLVPMSEAKKLIKNNGGSV